MSDNEWYTPVEYLEAARLVMNGPIDLDPASHEQANQFVKASQFYTKADDGLTKTWKAQRLWLNPPYGITNGQSNNTRFIFKLLEEYRAGNVEQAILLTMSDTDSIWFEPLFDFPICFSRKKVHFYKPTARGILEKDSRNSHFFGTVFVYIGMNDQRFIDVFSRFGRTGHLVGITKKPAIEPASLWTVA